jgi:hypothetical protein
MSWMGRPCDAGCEYENQSPTQDQRNEVYLDSDSETQFITRPETTEIKHSCASLRMTDRGKA